MNRIHLEIEGERELKSVCCKKIVTEVWRHLSSFLVFVSVMVFVNNIYRHKGGVGAWERGHEQMNRDSV